MGKHSVKEVVNSIHMREAWVLVQRIVLVMILLTLTRNLFFLFNLEHFRDISISRFLRILSGGLQFDISAFMYLNAPYILLFILPFPFRYSKGYQRILKYLFFFINGIMLAANIMDFFYYDFILKRSTADEFRWVFEDNILRLIRQFVKDYFVGIVIWFCLLFIMIYFYNMTRLPRPAKIIKKLYYPTGILFLLITTYLSIIGMRGSFVHSFRPISLGNAAKYTEKPREISLVLNTPFSILKTINKQALEEKRYFDTKELKEIYTPIHKPENDLPFRKLNVVIFVLESYSKEFIGAFNQDLEAGRYSGYTPFLDSLIQVSTTSDRSFANGRRSIEALPSIVASIPSMVEPYVTTKYASNRITGLASLLKNKGYQTGFFHGAPNGSMGFEAFMNLAGYEQYYGMDEYGKTEDYDGIWGIWDEEFFQYFARELNNFKEPFHATLFSVSSHHPYKVPPKYKGLFKEGPLDFHIPVQYTDLALRKFFETASQLNWYENTLFVITADHAAGQAYFDKYKTQAGKYSIPIIFFLPSEGNVSKSIDKRVIQQIDIMPTVLGWLNYPDPFFAFGHDALQDETRHFAVNYAENAYQLISGDYILQFRADKSLGLYNYVRDDLLKDNLVDKAPEVQQEMEKFLRAFIQQYNNRMIGDELTAEE